MAQRILKIIMNGVTGRMGRTQVTSERAPAVKTALAAGKHIYCEKLIAHDLRTARKLAELATQSGLKNGVVQDKLFLPGLRKLKALVENGFFGRILSVSGIGALDQSDIRVKMGIEPLHPMFTADRSVIVSLSQANAIIELFKSRTLGMVIYVYHVWWDPAVYSEIERASDHIFGFHVSDWIVPVPDMLNGRGIMGDGVIAIKRLREAVTQAGYNGPIEVEIFNEELWQLPGGELLRLIKDRFLQYV